MLWMNEAERGRISSLKMKLLPDQWSILLARNVLAYWQVINFRQKANVFYSTLWSCHLVNLEEREFSIEILFSAGSFGEWMNSHPEILSCVLPLVLQGLSNSKVGTAATIALKDITRESLDHIRPFIPQILSTSQVSLFCALFPFQNYI